MKKVALLCSLICITLLTASAAFAAPSLKIGGLFAVTGPAAFLGEPERNTAMMVVSEINRAGGIRGQKLELVVYDTAGDATKAVQLANKLIKSDRVMAIIGPSTTGESMAVIPVAERGRVPLISCAAGIKITEPLKKWVFKTAQNDSLAVIRIYEHLKKQRLQRVALLTVSDGFGASGREQLKAQAARYGIRIVADDTYGPKDTDMTSQLTKIRGLKPDAIICWGTNPGPAVITKNARQLGIKTPLFMSHGVSSKKYIQLAGKAAEGVKLPSGRVIVADQLPASDPQKRSLIAFVKGYERYYKAEGDHFGGHAWDAVMLLKGAFERGATTPAAVRDQLENTRQFHGIGGSFTFTSRDHAGLGKDAFVLVEVRKGDWAIVK
ncbi:ABC transporter substrate-binding protein [Pelobacter propionicus]|uniref:Amino acid/amide ABC transporter substrate-binding protein, HAAT family n=1 Tax=Pelobacter propionicus (strain DSM 2379 / NBRC 103807 / OttBd1) TaxID=338966 RepID=A1APL5_PELPD|nr:ABC transporter substrate-binding protein [Pelobacter propionicus]ABK99285.1 amino acid/amide ABC transporter substrate-binding protein, HAAT family [Pelobacter propionicus DSM 2379]